MIYTTINKPKKLCEHIIDLDNLQSKENNGRGIDCVRALLYELRNNKFDVASAIAKNEWIKISAYPVVANVIKEIGLVKKNAYIPS